MMRTTNRTTVTMLTVVLMIATIALSEADADGSTTVYFGPTQPAGIKRGNWIQTMPNKGWFMLLRLYSPLEPFFDKSWRPSEVEMVK